VSVFSNKIKDPVLAIVWGKRLRMVQVLCNQGNKSPNPEEDLVFVDICDFMLEKAVKGSNLRSSSHCIIAILLLYSSRLLIVITISTISHEMD
jgi:hypothetical protein